MTALISGLTRNCLEVITRQIDVKKTANFSILWNFSTIFLKSPSNLEIENWQYLHHGSRWDLQQTFGFCP